MKAEIVRLARGQGGPAAVAQWLDEGPPGRAKQWAADHGLPEHLHPGRGHQVAAAPVAGGVGPEPGGVVGGQPRVATRKPSPEPVVAAQEWHISQLDEQIAHATRTQGVQRDERNLLSGQVNRSTRAQGGTNETSRVELDNGLVGYHKPFEGVHSSIPAGFGQKSAQQPIHEVAAWRLAERLGEPYERLVAPCVMKEVSGRQGSFSQERAGVPMRPPGEIDEGEQHAAAFFDCLIGQQDRHPGNYLMAGDRVTLIDHGYAFARPGDYLNHSFFQRSRAGGDEKTRRLTGPEIQALDTLTDSEDTCGLQGVLEPDRLSALLERARAMRREGTILRPGVY